MQDFACKESLCTRLFASVNGSLHLGLSKTVDQSAKNVGLAFLNYCMLCPEFDILPKTNVLSFLLFSFSIIFYRILAFSISERSTRAPTVVGAVNTCFPKTFDYILFCLRARFLNYSIVVSQFDIWSKMKQLIVGIISVFSLILQDFLFRNFPPP